MTAPRTSEAASDAAAERPAGPGPLAATSLALVGASLLFVLGVSAASAQDARPTPTPAKQPATAPLTSAQRAAERGLRALLTEPMTTAFFSLDELERVWTVWEADERDRAKAMTREQRRVATFRRYGLIERLEGDKRIPVGYTPDKDARLATNCFGCHAGKVAGKTILGAPNTHQDYTTLFEDLELLRAKQEGRALRRQDVTLQWVPSFVRGGSNAFTASVLLGSARDVHMNKKPFRLLGLPIQHDEDAPAWWGFRKRTRIYWTGFAHPSPRVLMQLFTDPGNSGERLRALEGSFQDVVAYLKSLRPPRYPFPIDEPLAQAGRLAFEKSCSGCHGTYGETPSYPNKVVPIGLVKTDPVRLRALPRAWKEHYNKSWITHYGKFPFELAPKGYQAPPLDGVWASAPYLHNGSVPTLAAVLDPSLRPSVWRRSEDGYDRARVGLEVKALERVPSGLSAVEARNYYDTSFHGHGKQGHTFAAKLSPKTRRALLEYLKTL